MRNLFLLTFCLFLKSSIAQSFLVGHKQQTFVDASRNNRNITTEIYYPAASSGSNAPIANGKFPVLVFGHGFVMAWSAYEIFWKGLVPKGYIMVFPTTESSLSPSHDNFGKDINFLARALKLEGSTQTSFFYNSVSEKSAAMGHSMGGGSAFLAAQGDTVFTVLATFAPAVTNPSSVVAAKNIKTPAIVFAGANDCVTPPPQHQLPMYDSLNSNCKTYISIIGGSHCQFAGYNFNCSFGEGTCSPQPAITPIIQQEIMFSLLKPWLDYYLQDSCNAAKGFQDLVAAGSGITSKQNCALSCSETGFQNPKQINNLPTPNPFTFSTSILNKPGFEKAIFNLSNSLGQKVYTDISVSNDYLTVYRGQLPVGIYYLHISNGDAVSMVKLVIKD
jgi:hypothetical protein